MPKQSAAALDRAFRALSDPTRRAVVQRLARGPATVTELSKPLSISLPALHQHLQMLEESGLIASEKVGRVRTCRIEPNALSALEVWLKEQRATWEARFDRLDAYLAAAKEEESENDGSS